MFYHLFSVAGIIQMVLGSEVDSSTSEIFRTGLEFFTQLALQLMNEAIYLDYIDFILKQKSRYNY